MAMFAGTVKWFAEHTVPIIIIGIILMLTAALLLLTDPGKNLVKFLADNPIFILFLVALLAAPIIVYIYMLRPHDPEADRLDPLAVWEAAKSQGWASVYQLSNYEFVSPAIHPSAGIIFTGEVFRGYKRTSIMLSDRKSTAGRFMRDWAECLTKDEIDKYFRKSISLEEKLVMGRQANAQIEQLSKRSSEEEGMWGTPSPTPVK